MDSARRWDSWAEQRPPEGASRAGSTGVAAGRHRRPGALARWLFRSLLIVPFVLMGPEVIAAVLGRPSAITNISTSTADVLGTSSLIVFVMMLAITPIHTMTGWTWHIPLRRDYGVAMFATATTDLFFAATTTGNTFSGGVLGRVGGHTFLVAGSLATFLLIPLVVTANRRAQSWLGGYWKKLHRLVYVIWVVVMIHLLFLFGISGIFIAASALSLPLAVIRIPRLRIWWSGARRNRQTRVRRWVLALLLCGIFVAGYVPLAHELVVKGGAAFMQTPADN